MKVFLHPVIGSPQFACVIAVGGWTLSWSMCDRFEPEDDARFAGYNLTWECDYNHWREADKGEALVILEMIRRDDPEMFAQLTDVSEGVSGS